MSLKNADKFGIIDIGSNTIRGVLYSGGENPAALDTITFQSNILESTLENKLTAEGIFNLSESISEIKKGFGVCEYIFAFATSAMRDVANFDEVFEKVKKRTGVKIELISGELEAEYDYLAIRGISDKKSGIGVDLGGGSAQVVVFDENGVKESLSMPIGVKRVRNMFCKDIVPTDDEIIKIEKYIEKQISPIKGSCDVIWFMGGTAKAVSKAAKKLLGKDEVTPDVIDGLYDITAGNIPLLMNIFKKRYDTMPVGFVVMKSICKNLGGKKIKVTEVGVRDGYVLKHMEDEND